MMFDVMGAMIVLATSGAPHAAETPESEAAPTSDRAHGWDDLETESKNEPSPTPTVQASPPQPEGPTPAELERKKQRQRARGLTAGGWTTFGVTYAAALTIGVASIDLAGDDRRQRTWGRRMAIPVGGPFAAAFVSASATGTLFTVLTGAAQITGIALGTAGAVMLARQKRDPNFAFAIVPDASGGAHMGATWRF
jgi:hypothetical protein